VTGAAQLCGALALLLSFALLCQRRRRTSVCLCAVQALLVSLAAGLQGTLPLALFATVAFVLNGLALPFALLRIGDRSGRQPSFGPPALALLAVALVAVAVAVAMRLGTGTRTETLAVALSIMLLGLLQITRTPSLGLLSAQNGLILAAGAVPGLPPLALAVVAVPCVPALMVALVWLRRFDRLEAEPS